MKKMTIVLFIVAVLFATQALSLSDLGERNVKNIEITLVNQEPDPVEPGNYVTVRFKIENTGYENAENVIFELIPEYPFSLDPGKTEVKKIGSVHGKQIGDIGVIIDYRLKVDEKAVEGDEGLEFRYRLGEGGSWIEPQPVDIEIRTADAILAVNEVTSENFEPGKTSQLTIKAQNLADSYLRNLNFNLDLADTVFTPTGSSNEKTILKLAPKETQEINFNIRAAPDADASVYNIPLSVTYYDELNNEYNKDLTIGLVVGASPDMSVLLDESEIKTPGKKGTVSVRFVNKGTTGIKFLNAYLLDKKEYEILSNKEIYIGDVDSDDYETADYKLYVNPTEKDSIKLPLKLTYKDANNNDYQEQLNLNLKLYSNTQAKRFGFAESSPLITIVIILVIVVAAIIGYRYYKKRK